MFKPDYKSSKIFILKDANLNNFKAIISNLEN